MVVIGAGNQNLVAHTDQSLHVRTNKLGFCNCTIEKWEF